MFEVDGGWSDWSPWTMCSKTCGKGQKYRRRECNSPKPINGGAVCEGSNFEMKNCKIHNCRNADLVKSLSFVSISKTYLSPILTTRSTNSRSTPHL